MSKEIRYALRFIWDGHIRTNSMDSFLDRLVDNDCGIVEAVPYTWEGGMQMGFGFGAAKCDCKGYFAARTEKGRPFLLIRDYGNSTNLYIPSGRVTEETRAERKSLAGVQTDVKEIKEAIPEIKIKLVNLNSCSQSSFEILRRLDSRRDETLKIGWGLVSLLGG
jgi:hypothetical protein